MSSISSHPYAGHVAVIVLGDTGRSPRMQFHAVSLAELSDVERVTLIGYSGENCGATIQNNEKIRDIRISPSSFKSIETIRSYSSILHAIIKGIILLLSIVRVLCVAAKSYSYNGKLHRSVPISLVIIQNPPASPVVLAAYFYRALIFVYGLCTFTKDYSQVSSFTICIDWHNLGFTLYYDKYKPTHYLVRINYMLEKIMAKLSDINFCVSEAMQKWLSAHYGISSTVFYDRPPKSVFQKFNKSNIESTCSENSNHGCGSSENSSSNIDDLEYSSVPLEVRHDLLQRLNLTDATLFPFLVATSSCDGNNSFTSRSVDDDDDDDIYQSVGEDLSVHHMKSKHNPAVAEITDPSAHSDMTEVTLQTYRHRRTGEVKWRLDRAVVLLSSTSWTPDEDFSLLTKALINLDKDIAKRRKLESPRKKQDPFKYKQSRLSNFPTRVVVVITGKGPLKDQFMSDWLKSQEEGNPNRLSYISLVSVWLEVADYPLMVGCADMGICLHTSSSGIDLPMKVLDMFGSGVPVCAVSFPALPELVKNGVNGIIFRTAPELSAHLFRLFCDFPRDESSLENLKEMKRMTLKIGSWEENWGKVVHPVIRGKIHLPKLDRKAHIIFALCFALLSYFCFYFISKYV